MRFHTYEQKDRMKWSTNKRRYRPLRSFMALARRIALNGVKRTLFYDIRKYCELQLVFTVRNFLLRKLICWWWWRQSGESPVENDTSVFSIILDYLVTHVRWKAKSILSIKTNIILCCLFKEHSDMNYSTQLCQTV